MNSLSTALFLGADIGTTTLSFSVVSMAEKRVIRTVTLPHESALNTPGTQDAQRICALALRTLDALLAEYPGVASIGVTGQMHGILCPDRSGVPVTPLYTWQCPIADEALCAEILHKTGMRVHPGYGHATLYALHRQGLIPKEAAQYCTIMDNLVMQLTGRTSPLMHATNAASLGLYSTALGRFDEDALRALSLPMPAPAIAAGECVCGLYRGIPVCAAIGDNQASFYGSIRDESACVLVNYGTGSQLSLVCDTPAVPAGCEIRPYPGGRYLLCKSALCGGRAYAMLERFWRDYLAAAGCSGSTQYETMNRLAEQALQAQARLRVNTQFCGTREEPGLRGSIAEISEESFTPGALILGTLQGMVDELAEAFRPDEHPQIRRLVASGNAVQKNPVLRRLLADTFAMPLSLPVQKEEAAFGAALCAAVTAGIVTKEAAKLLIRYAEE